MSVPRAHDGSCDLTVQPTVSALHIPATHAFIPFQQFSLTDTSGLRNPADDNNNKTAVPVVSVVTAVSGLCPAIPVVSMQQQAQLGQAVVAPTIIPTVVAPMAVQTANGITPTTTMTMTNTLNISSHLSVPTPQQQQVLGSTGINLNLPNSAMNSSNSNNGTPAATGNPSNKPVSSGNKPTNGSSNSNSSTSSNNSCNSPPAKSSNSGNPKPSPSSGSQNSDQTTDDLVKPVFKDGELVLEVECGQNKAILYLSKLCQGSKGPCISFQSSWLTPNEFQFVSGRETAKDWKRSIRHHGKSLKLLLAKGILNVHPTMCDCDGCRQGATLTRKGEKRRIPNGERKPRKPSSGAGNGGNEAHVPGAFRPVGNSTMAAHLASPGGTQTKPDAKRPASDKHKIGDTVPPSQLKEALVNASKQNLSVKSEPSQRPDSLETPGDSEKKVSKTLSTCATASAPTSPVESKASGSIVLSIPSSSLQSNSSSAPTTPVRVQPFCAGVAMPPTMSAQSNQQINSFIGASQLSQVLPLSTTPLSVAVGNPENLTGSSNIDNKPIRSPSLPSGEQMKTSSTTVDSVASTVNLSTKFDADLEEGSHENSEMDDAVNSDANVDEDSEEEDGMSDDTGKESDNNYSSNNKDTFVSGSNQESLPKDLHSSENGGSQGCSETIDLSKTSSGKTNAAPETANPSEAALPSEDLSTPSDEPVVTESSSISSFSISPSTPKASATLAVSAVSGSCSQPLSVSVSTTNVKSEHIWVPPTLSPADDKQHIHRALKGSSTSMKSPSQKTHQSENTHSNNNDIYVSSSSIKTEEKHHSAKNLSTSENRQEQSCSTFNRGNATVKQENASIHKEPYSIERHLSHNSEKELKTKYESNPKGSVPISSSTVDRSVKDREREERLKQKIREDRNRKDREREERREKERREEKDIERRRHEEKERLARAQAENAANKQERSSVTPVAPPMDPSRRPPGGVADAAAFSDYMRVLAAGHGHTFMPPTPTYFPSLFPIRPPDTPLPSPLFNPYAPQMSGIPKDHILYPTPAGTIQSYPASHLGPYHPLMQRAQYPGQPSLLEYQRSLAAASYPWQTAYPYLLPEMAVSSSSSAASAAAAAVKRHSTEMEVAMELNTKRMRLDSRPPEYSSPLDYFAAAAAAASQQQRAQLQPSLPCGLESASMDKTAEYLRKRYMEYGPQAAAYLSALPEYARPMYHCACADHREEDVRMWSVDEVCKFLTSLDGCSIYSDHFREQRVDGRILALLTTDHLVKTLGMKLGPAILLSEAVAKKLQDISKMSNCEACRNIAMSQSMPPMAIPM